MNYEFVDNYGNESTARKIPPLKVADQDVVHLLNIAYDVFLETNCRIFHASQVAYRSGYFIRIYRRSGSRVRVRMGLGLFLAGKGRFCSSLFREREDLNADGRNCK